MKDSKRLEEIIRRLSQQYPEPKSALRFTTEWELLVATILSAQTTDSHVNKVTEGLFGKFRAVADYARTPLETLQREVGSINFYKTKARNIHAAAKMVMERYRGKVPRTMEELVTLPGVARKTANIILWNAYGINEGVAVDTHVKRLAGRLGLTEHDDPVKIEQDLMALAPRERWGELSHLLILHGRTVCHARQPKHSECVLFDLCPSRDI
ncbi:MAG: endonuclease III [Chloroflexota bacterium]